MVEINPLAITGSGDLVALDAKMSFDTKMPCSAAPKWPRCATCSQGKIRAEAMAAGSGLSYIGLDGDIGLHHQRVRAWPWPRWI